MVQYVHPAGRTGHGSSPEAGSMDRGVRTQARQEDLVGSVAHLVAHPAACRIPHNQKSRHMQGENRWAVWESNQDLGIDRLLTGVPDCATWCRSVRPERHLESSAVVFVMLRPATFVCTTVCISGRRWDAGTDVGGRVPGEVRTRVHRAAAGRHRRSPTTARSCRPVWEGQGMQFTVRARGPDARLALIRGRRLGGGTPRRQLDDLDANRRDAVGHATGQADRATRSGGQRSGPP